MALRNKINALVVGAGNIGAFFDTPNKKDVLTHAHAYSVHDGFELLGFYDVDFKKAQKAADIWGVKAFNSIEDAFKQNQIDVVSVAVPDDKHYEMLKYLSDHLVKLVFTEKPLTATIRQAQEILDLYRARDIAVLVNYSRRFVREFEDLKIRIDKGDLGGFLSGTGYYGKGIAHNGSHLIDLLRYLLGEIKSWDILDSETDFYPDDPSVSAALRFKDGGKFVLQIINCNHFSIFEIDMLFEKGRVRMINSGFNIEEYQTSSSALFKGYKNIVKTKEYGTELGRAIYYAIDNIYKYLTKGESLKCPADSAFRTLKVCLGIKGENKK